MIEKTAGPFGQFLGIRCVIEHGVIADIQIGSRRRLPVERLLAGKSPEAVQPLLGTLFSICRHAHELAAMQALAMARGERPCREALLRGERLCDLEGVREHGLNLLQSISDETAPDLARELTASIRELSSLIGTESAEELAGGRFGYFERLTAVLHRMFGDFWRIADLELDEVLDWSKNDTAPAAHLLRSISPPDWAAFGACDMSGLPPLSAGEIQQILEQTEPSSRAELPTWNGMPCESGCFSRQVHVRLVAQAVRRYGNGLLARTLARMVEVKMLMDRLSQPGDLLGVGPESHGKGQGIAQVEASRGRLIHRVILEHGRVKDYRILAPTEWNFHPAGVVRRALLGTAASDMKELQAKVLALLRCIDPCVQFDLSFSSVISGNRVSAVSPL